MTTLQYISLFLMAAFYLFAGISHFRQPKFFLKITPPWVPSPDKVNIIVGSAEVLLGLGLLIESTRSMAAIGIIILLVAVFPANIFHHIKARRKNKHVLATLIRLPLQALLIYWAYSFV